ncbi:MAG TPA: class I SAM-dependent methyltransferase [Candidatus Saccharimonadales bacterium]|nr:class I SAM-dependent methyltransferase [Candidatus Saccharimonadales bacterium]
MDSDEFNSFFKIHAQNVDNADALGFWKLTDTILETILLENMPKRDGVTVVDFGGGTGRWLLKLDKYFTNSKFIVVDLSKDMLAQAQKKIDESQYTNTVELVESDIASVEQLEDGTADYIISTYNPLSFCAQPQKVIDEAYRIVKPGGRVMITIQGYYNALYSKVNNYLADAVEQKEIFEEKKVQWSESVPKLWQLPQEDMEGMFNKSGLSTVHSRGIACITQPQAEDFDPENKQLGSLSKKLNDDPTFFKTLLEIELAISKVQGAINRAMNILTVGDKTNATTTTPEAQ